MRAIRGPMGSVVTVGLVGAALFHIWLGSVGVMDLRLMRASHLLLLLPFAFLLYPAIPGRSPESRPSLFDVVLAALAVTVTGYVVVEAGNLNERLELVTQITDLQIVLGTIAVILMGEATRRVVGWGMAVIVAISVAYLFLGQHLPSPLGHRGFAFGRAIELMYLLENQGIFGSLTGISVTYLFLFVLFGTFVARSGVGDWFAEISQSLAGHRVGGPAKIAVINSAMFGSISGSPTANVYGTGVYTIPLMKRMGYRPAFAGAVEAAASTGGQIMPPVMGASVFIMMALLGRSYIDIIIAALPAAVLFFFAVGAMVHLEARRLALPTLPKAGRAARVRALKRSYYVMPIVTMLVVLALGYSAVRGALAGIAIAILVSFVNREYRMTPAVLCNTFAAGTKSAILIAVACSAAGIVVSALTATGLSLTFSSIIVSAGGGMLVPGLIMVGLTAILLGMGLPTTPAYILTVTVAAPALTDLGVVPLAAHMFVFYFAIISGVTPPVAITSYAAAGIARASPVTTSVEAFKLSVAGFVIPFAFVFHPSLLLEGDIADFVTHFSIALIGIVAIAASMTGYLAATLPTLLRILAFAAGVLILLPNWRLSAVGFALLIPLAVQQAGAREERQRLDGSKADPVG